MILSCLLLLGALAILARLAFGLAVHTLPVAAGAASAYLAHATGAGLLGAGVIGLITGTLALAASQTLFALAASTWSRLMVGIVFALPAAAIGFGIAYGLLAGIAPAPAWRMALALVGALVTGGVAFQRVAALAPTGAPWSDRDEAVGRTHA